MIVFSTQAQTRLINHKSHSGTNKTFTPKTVGNFGLSYVDGELDKKENSNYKLVFNSMNYNSYTYYLFYTERKDNRLNNVCLAGDKIIETVEISVSDEDYEKTIKRLKIKLKKLRKTEKNEQ